MRQPTMANDWFSAWIAQVTGVLVVVFTVNVISTWCASWMVYAVSVASRLAWSPSQPAQNTHAVKTATKDTATPAIHQRSRRLRPGERP